MKQNPQGYGFRLTYMAYGMKGAENLRPDMIALRNGMLLLHGARVALLSPTQGLVPLGQTKQEETQ